MTAFVFALQCAGHRRVSFDAAKAGLGLRAGDRTNRMAWAAFQTAVPGAYRAAQTSTSTC